jgi:peptide/nickel transport system substrate-binding protein
MKKYLLFVISVLTVLSMALSACGTPTPAATPEPTEEVKEEVQTGPVTVYNEAPMLHEKVLAGELPNVDERLPAEPIIVEPVESVGEYGGTVHTATWWAQGGNFLMWMYDPPIRWKADYTGYEPGIATYEWSEDGKTFTLHFIKGIKWSDGVPFTMEDIKFWWEDMALNEEYKVTSVPWYMYKSDAKTPIDMEFPDDYTWVWKSDQAMWVSPYILAQGYWEWLSAIPKPKHFLTQFHPKYTAGADYTMLEANDKMWEIPGYPCLVAWCLKDYVVGEKQVYERNPYYFKVDTAGNQLPYIDTIQVDLVTDAEVRTLNLSQGKYEISFRVTDDPRNIPFLAEQAEANNYTLWPGWMNGAGAWPGWIINQDYNGTEPEAAEIRELLRNKYFRKGLSVSLDRQRFVDVVWEGIGTPQQATISPQSWHFAESTGQGPAILAEWQQADAEYDVAKAADYFEQAKFTDQDGDGWRDLPSGKPFTLILTLTDWGGSVVATDAATLAEEYFDAVGINTLVDDRIGEPEVFVTESTFMLRSTHASEVDIWTYPDWVFPLRNNRAWPMQGKYRETGGKEGWEPEVGSPAARLQNLYDKGMQTSSEQERHEIVWEAIRIHIEEGPFTLGVAGDQAMPVVLKNGVHNVPTYGVLGPWAPGSPGNVNPEQFWMEASLRGE